MRHIVKGLGTVVAILACVFPAVSRGGDGLEIASFKGTGYPMNWVALSSDGLGLPRPSWIGRSGTTARSSTFLVNLSSGT